MRFTKCQTEKLRHNRLEQLLEVLLEKNNGKCNTNRKPNCTCMPTHKWKFACSFFGRSYRLSFFQPRFPWEEWEALATFSFQMQSMRRIHFGWLLTTRNASNEEKNENQDNCSWPSWRGILQSSKTKTPSSEEWMNDTMDWMNSRYFNRWKT